MELMEGDDDVEVVKGCAGTGEACESYFPHLFYSRTSVVKAEAVSNSEKKIKNQLSLIFWSMLCMLLHC